MKFSELVNITELKDLCESFTAATGAATALLELDGTVLISTGWQDICTQFHRINPQTAQLCRESDTHLSARLRVGDSYTIYTCRNGMVDVAVPIIIGGDHIANLFTGQFFLAPPDRGFFSRQAEMYGFDHDAYLSALDRVPVYDEDHIKKLLDFLARLARLMGEIGLSRIRLEKTNRDLTSNQERLEEEITDRKNAEARLSESEQKIRANEERLQRSQAIAHVASWEYDVTTGRIWGSPEGFRLYGLKPSPEGDIPLEEVEACAVDPGKVRTALRELIELGKPYNIEIEISPADGSERKIIRAIADLIRDREGKPLRAIGVAQDITRQKLAEKDLMDSVAFLSSLIDQSPISTAITDAGGTLIRINRPSLELLNLTEAEVIGKYNLLKDNLVEEQGFLPRVRSVFEEGRIVHFELAYDTSKVNGLALEKKAVVELEVTIFPIRDSRNIITNAVIQHIDITKRKLAEAALRESEEHFRTLVEQSPVSIQILSPDGRTLRINKACADMWGVRLEDLDNYNILKDEQLVRLGVMPYIEKGFRGEITEIPPAQYDARNSLGIGIKRWVRSRIYPVKDPGGAIRFLILMHEDITSQVKAIEALKKSESQYRRIVETANEGIWSMDASHVTTFVNQKMADMLKYPVGEIMGRPIADFIFPEDLPDNARQMELRHSGHNSVYEGRIRTGEGSIRWMKVSATAIFDDAGAFAGSFAMLFDITDRKLAEEALLRKNEELAAATEEMTAIDEELRQNYDELRKIQDALGLARRKLNILNQVTFEDLQSGIFSLSAYVELCGGKASDEKKADYLAKQKAILRNLSKNLAFARNYQGLGMTPPKWQNVNQAFLFAISHMDTLYLTRDVELGGLEIYADPLLERVFGILVENVLKWGTGATSIRLHYTDLKEGLLLTFEDNGEGIVEEKKERIFERELRQDAGLGLYLVREILSITGITIRETGMPGSGARFEISVPEGAYRFSDER
jgi:PAS domain S-box-containing protein